MNVRVAATVVVLSVAAGCAPYQLKPTTVTVDSAGKRVNIALDDFTFDPETGPAFQRTSSMAKHGASNWFRTSAERSFSASGFNIVSRDADLVISAKLGIMATDSDDLTIPIIPFPYMRNKLHSQIKADVEVEFADGTKYQRKFVANYRCVDKYFQFVIIPIPHGTCSSKYTGNGLWNKLLRDLLGQMIRGVRELIKEHQGRKS